MSDASQQPQQPPEALPATGRNSTDAVLVAQCLQGNKRAYEWLVIRYQSRVQRLIARIVRDDAMAEDLAQETFIRAYRALPGFRGDAKFYTWLYRIAVNTAKKYLIRQKRNPVVHESALATGRGDGDGDNMLEQLAEVSPETPETQYAARQIAQAVNAAMNELPDELREALMLREIEGLSYDDIAVAMHCPIGTVRSRIYRAREAVSRRIAPMLEQRSGKRW